MAATRPRVREEVTVCEIDGEAVVYDPDGSKLHYLNHSAALVLDLCDGEATMKEMAEAIADVYEMPVDDVETQVRSMVRDLRSHGLLVPTRKAPVDEAPSEPAESAEAASDEDERAAIRMQVPRSS